MTTTDKTPMEGSCHCGDVKITVPHRPEFLNSCTCTICYKYGTLWGYYTKDEVKIEGPTDIYTKTNGVLDFHRCKHCGCIIAWLERERSEENGVGMNMRMFDGKELEGVEFRKQDFDDLIESYPYKPYW